MMIYINSTRLNVTLMPLVNGLFPYPYQREHYLYVLVLSYFWPVLLFGGLLSNATNIVVFLKVGVKDSVSTLLLTLSISDFIFLSFFSPSILRESFSRFGTFRISTLSVVRLLLFWPAFTFYDFSSYISVFLGVARCACVAMPLRFKSVFTVKRTVVAVLALFCLDVLLHFPILSVFRLGWVRDSATNTSSLSLVRDSHAVHIYKHKIDDALNRISFPYFMFIIMVASVALLSFKLFESSKIRSSAYNAQSNDQTGNSSKTKQTNSHKLSPKDVKVVQSVILVCSIFIAAQIPSLIYTPFRSFFPGLNRLTRFSYLFAIAAKTEWLFMMMNSSVNILIYYNYNSKFRSVLRSLLNWK